MKTNIYGNLTCGLKDGHAYIKIVGGPFNLFLIGERYARFIDFLRTFSEGDDAKCRRTIVLRIMSPWRAAHDWTFLPSGVADLSSDGPGEIFSADIIPADRDRLLADWDAHLADVAAKKATPPADPLPEAPAPEPSKTHVSLPVIKE